MVSWDQFQDWLTAHDVPKSLHDHIINIEFVPTGNNVSTVAIWLLVTIVMMDELGHPVVKRTTGELSEPLTETLARPMVSFPEGT